MIEDSITNSRNNKKDIRMKGALMYKKFDMVAFSNGLTSLSNLWRKSYHILFQIFRQPKNNSSKLEKSPLYRFLLVIVV